MTAALEIIKKPGGNLGFNAVTVGKYINLLVTATSFSAKCSIIRHMGYHNFFAEYFCAFFVVVVCLKPCKELLADLQMPITATAPYFT